jgi:uncharacterized protein YuzE
MTKPQAVEIDVESGAGYVAYSKEKVAETRDVWEDGTVAADLDARGNVVGIEMLALDSETLAQARAYAAGHDLVFPPLDDLTVSI